MEEKNLLKEDHGKELEELKKNMEIALQLERRNHLQELT